ncbi:hypothetical protein Y1Q_0015270 [Alligator mississippiensis]|uniref:Uncharacterized protein n=1 Tax=Alligator mississippiensis TaxID=8496 RepID=A0A151MRB7_ALLMI|nr:hypothetical protein Y1Q_0015270 [Alligator mississippiensis]
MKSGSRGAPFRGKGESHDTPLGCSRPAYVITPRQEAGALRRVGSRSGKGRARVSRAGGRCQSRCSGTRHAEREAIRADSNSSRYSS